MYNLTKRCGMPTLLGLAVLGFATPELRAQPTAPIYPGGPGYQQYLNGLRAASQQFGNAPAYLRQAAVNPVLPGLPPGGGGTIVNSPYQGMTSDPGYGGYGGYNSIYYYDPYGGYLRGAAEVINAQGRFAIAQQQAVLTREQIKAERIANRKRAFDEWLYERERMPTLEDERQRMQREELRRAMNNPPVTEIWSGKALNDLLAELQKQLAKGSLTTAPGAEEAFDDDTLKHINVTSRQGTNVGLLKNDGRLSWPFALTGPEFKDERERLTNLSEDVVKQARFANRIDAGTLKQMTDDMEKINKSLTRQVGDLSPSQYIEAKRFLNNMNDALRVLQQPDAVNYFNRKYAARGKNVPELVKYMTDQGLQFAPAVPGDEASYVAVQRAMAAWAQAVQPVGGGGEAPR